MLIFYFIAAVVCFLCCVIYIPYSFERKGWNKGVCSDNGQPWLYCYTAFDGVRWYQSGPIGARYFLPVVWPVDRRYART